MAEHLAFLAQLQEQFDGLPKGDRLMPFRQQAWQQFLAIGLPTRSEEAFRYVSLRELYASSFHYSSERLLDRAQFEQAILPECKHSYLLFVDGAFCPELSDVSALPQQLILLPLEEALHSHAGFLQNHVSRALKEEKDPFALLNLSLHAQGAFFYLPPKLRVTTPVQCLHVTTTPSAHRCLARMHLILGAHSELRWVSSHHSLHSETSHLLIPSTEIVLEEGAHLDWLNLADTLTATWHLESIRAVVKKQAQFNFLSATLGTKTFRQSIAVQLKGEQAKANLNGIWMLSKHRHAHVHAFVDHQAPHTHSMQLFKGVLNDATSQSSFEGKIRVQEEALKTEAYQLNKNLILSSGAIANSKPNLEVFADDVKASHGATVAQLDEEQLLYLNTRGISGYQARQLLINAFCREMIEPIPYSSVLRRMQKNIQDVIQNEYAG
jgi:Fe-S cluster assembly protein SufD